MARLVVTVTSPVGAASPEKSVADISTLLTTAQAAVTTALGHAGSSFNSTTDITAIQTAVTAVQTAATENTAPVVIDIDLSVITTLGIFWTYLGAALAQFQACGLK